MVHIVVVIGIDVVQSNKETFTNRIIDDKSNGAGARHTIVTDGPFAVAGCPRTGANGAVGSDNPCGWILPE